MNQHFERFGLPRKPRKLYDSDHDIEVDVPGGVLCEPHDEETIVMLNTLGAVGWRFAYFSTPYVVMWRDAPVGYRG